MLSHVGTEDGYVYMKRRISGALIGSMLIKNILPNFLMFCLIIQILFDCYVEMVLEELISFKSVISLKNYVKICFTMY